MARLLSNHKTMAKLGNHHAQIEKVRMLFERGRLKKGVNILHSLEHVNSSWVYSTLLQACIDNKTLSEAKTLHGHMIICGFQPNVVLDTKLVIMYTKFHCLEDAYQMFDKMSDRNVVTWTAMIAAYARNKQPLEALEFFRGMQRSCIRPDSFAVATMVPACGALGNVDYGRELQGYVVKSGFQCDVVVASGLVDMYFKCGRVEDARKVFDETPQPDMVLWNTLLAGYVYIGYVEEALRIFQTMPQPNVISWNTMIVGYGQNGYVNEALKLFEKMPERDIFSWHAMIGGYIQSGYVDEAMKLFDKIPQQDVASWNQMIFGCAQSGRIDDAFKIFQKMPEKDLISWNTMIAGYVQNGYVEEALDLFRQMPKQCVISWNTMIAGYTQNGLFNDALQLFQELTVKGEKPDKITFASVLPACANMAALEHGKVVHGGIIARGFESHTVVGNALLDMYAKCGSIGNAQNVFDEMPARDVVSWNSMIVGYALHGLGKEALQVFEKMEYSKMKPNHITFIGVLSACCHAGLLYDGWKHFNSMIENYDVMPEMEHYCCMVDLLSRAGHLYKAYDFICNMPIKPTAAVWASLLGACKIHSNIILGEQVAECLFQSDCKTSGHYVLISNIYAAAGRWDDVEKMRRMMKAKSVLKTPGSSWIEVNNKMYGFLAGDRSHPQTKEIYAELERLLGQMRETGYVPDIEFALHDVEEEQKEHILGYHSEKLAVVFGLINISSMAPITVIKNLRVCGDCHSAIKFISKIVSREIVLRDAIRFHHFRNGHCSCGDYW